MSATVTFLSHQVVLPDDPYRPVVRAMYRVNAPGSPHHRRRFGLLVPVPRRLTRKRHAPKLRALLDRVARHQVEHLLAPAETKSPRPT
jgi:hypothetical protein